LFGGIDRSLRAAINQHVHRNPEDWSVEDLFDKLGAFDASDRRFALFIEGLASSEVRPDEAAQRRFVQIVNGSLQGCGVEMRESDAEDGYPIFTVVSTLAASMGRPKNLIFASSVKPDIRFRDAVNNDIEIVTNADKVLVYDRPISVDGLRWRDLQSWWSETEKIADGDTAKKTLYRRLKASLPKNSPSQVLLFDAFHHGFGSAIPDLPVLLPEVWLHWDPKTVRERGPDALLRFRMDFLLLLPSGARAVVEVDGKHHYARDDGQADGALYAAMVAGDRELKLAGYEVFRFGAEELQGDKARGVVKEFFDRLFKRYGVIVPPT
jgi:very-short-patch-repair endonuclease